MAKQKLRYNDIELSVIKGTFAENDDLLFAIRKFFIQQKLDISEQAMILNLSEETKAVLRKTFLPEIDGNAPMFQMVDWFTSVETKDRDIEKANIEMEVRRLVVDYFGQQLGRIGGKEKEEIEFKNLNFSKEKDSRQNFIELSARNMILNQIDFQLQQLLTLAGMKNETIEQTKKKLEKDSSR